MSKRHNLVLPIVAAAVFAVAVGTGTITVADDPWHGLTQWTAHAGNPVLSAGAPGAWDEQVRERMWVTYDDGIYKAWYGGWKGTYDKTTPNLLHLGYATSTDGIHWTKHSQNPVFADRWVEDVCVVKSGGTFYLYGEDETNNETVIHLLTSGDGVNWASRGTVLEKTVGSSWEGGWVGTPLVWQEPERWCMLYEGGPNGTIGLATSVDGICWQKSGNNPAFSPVGDGWENQVVAADSVLKRDGAYYLFYHACGPTFRTGIAQSADLVNWSRYSGNPLTDDVSPVVVETPDRYLLYCWGKGAGFNLYVSAKTAPEPSTLTLIGAGLFACYAWRHLRLATVQSWSN